MLQCKMLRTEIETAINNCGLPIDAIYFVLRDVLNEVSEICNNVLEEEKQQEEQKQTEEEQIKNKEEK